MSSISDEKGLHRALYARYKSCHFMLNQVRSPRTQQDVDLTTHFCADYSLEAFFIISNLPIFVNAFFAVKSTARHDVNEGIILQSKNLTPVF